MRARRAPKTTCDEGSYAGDADVHRWCCKPHELVEADFADVLFRAAAFARVVAVGRAHSAEDGTGTEHPDTPSGNPAEHHDAHHREALSAARLLGLAEQLEHAGRVELGPGL